MVSPRPGIGSVAECLVAAGSAVRRFDLVPVILAPVATGGTGPVRNHQHQRDGQRQDGPERHEATPEHDPFVAAAGDHGGRDSYADDGAALARGSAQTTDSTYVVG